MEQNTLVDTSTPPDTETLLVDVVTDILKRANHPNPDAWKTELDMAAYEHAEGKQKDQIIRSCLRQVLSDAVDKVTGLDTFAERLCVVQDTNRQEWVRLFTTGVAPCMVKHNLPPTIN